MNIVFIRHGDPDYVHDRLTEKGIREAECLKKRLDKLTDADFYCSPLGRARETAEIALAGRDIKPVVLPYMQEFFYPVKDPMTGKDRIAWDFYPSYWTNFHEYYDNHDWRHTELMEDSEIPIRFKELRRDFNKLLEQYGYYRDDNFYLAKPGSDKTIVVFCHLGVEFALIGNLVGISPMVLWHQFFVAPTALTILTTEEREPGIASFRVRTFGDTSHLYAEGEPVSDSGLFPRKSFTI